MEGETIVFELSNVSVFADITVSSASMCVNNYDYNDNIREKTPVIGFNEWNEFSFVSGTRLKLNAEFS